MKKRAVTSLDVTVVYTPFLFDTFAVTAKVPHVLTVHDLSPLLFPRDFPKSYAVWRALYLRRIKTASAVIAVSESTKTQLLSRLKLDENRVFVVHNGATIPSTGEPRSSTISLVPYLLYVSSSTYPYKNINTLLEAFALLMIRIPHKLVIVGKRIPRFDAQLNGTIRRLKLEERLVISQDLSDRDLALHYQQAAAFIYPSLYEGFGIPPLEAMASGIPVVAGTASVVPEICGDAAYYVNPADPVSMAEGILAVLNSQSLRTELVQKGLARAALFSWETTAKQIVSICRAAVV